LPEKGYHQRELSKKAQSVPRRQPNHDATDTAEAGNIPGGNLADYARPQAIDCQNVA